jgi:hypothetical protein
VIVLRRELLVLGIMLLFIGVIATSEAIGIQEEKTISKDWGKTNPNAWSISGNFIKGRSLYSYIQPGKDWSAEYQGGINILNLSVTIQDPEGGKTKLRAVFSSDPLASDPRLQPHAVQVVSNDGGLTFEKSNELEKTDGTINYEQIRGTVTYSGVYNVTVYRWGAFTPSPPALIGLQSFLTEKFYPYWFVIVAGVASVISGVFLLVWVWKNPKNKKRWKADTR